MTSTKFLIKFSVMLFFLGVSAQMTTAQNVDFDNYRRLRSEGALPKVLLQTTIEKYEAQRKELSNEENKKTQNRKEEFVLTSSFAIDAFMKSGAVLFNDPVTNYLNLIKDYLLRDQPALIKKINVFTIRSGYANAFATHEGVIFVTTGLIARAENEASLAFVLAHEIEHYKRKHSIERHIKTAANESNRMSKMNEERANLAVSMYSKAQELEADGGGSELCQGTAYSSAALEKAFDLLSYSNEPFQHDKPIDVRMLSYGKMTFTNAFLQDSIKKIEVNEDFDDEGHTHPNVATRRKAFQDFIKTKGQADGLEFIFGIEQFEMIRNICRFEVAWGNVAAGAYELGIFHSLQLLKDFPNSVFLKQLVAVSLHKLVELSHEGRFAEIHLDHKEQTGEFQRLLYWLESVDMMGLNLAALHWTRTCIKQHPDNEGLKEIESDLFRQLFAAHDPEVKNYLKSGKVDAVKFNDPAFQDTMPQAHWANSMRGNADDLPINKLERYTDQALGIRQHLDITNQDGTFKLFETINADSVKKACNAGNAAESSENEWSQNFQLGAIKEMAFLSPQITMLRSGKNNLTPDLLLSYERGEQMKSIIKEAAGKLKMKVSIVDPEKLNAKDVNKYAALNEIKSLIYATYVGNEKGMPGSSKKDREELIKVLGTENVCLMRMESVYTSSKFFLIVSILLTIIFPPYFYLILLTYRRWVESYALIYNLKLGKVMAFRADTVFGSVNKSRLRAMIYNFMYTWKQKPR